LTIPVLAWLDAQPKPGQFLLQHDQRPRRLGFVPADDHQIVREADEPPQPAVASFPLPVKPVQVDVREQGRDDPTLGCAGVGAQQLLPDQDPGSEQRPDRLEDLAVDHPLGERAEQEIVVDLVERSPVLLPVSRTCRRR
jgi:hypothetical protein